MAVIQGERQYQMVKLTLASGDSIEATAEHPFYVKGKGWNPASSLKVGQALQLHNGTTVVINEIDTSVGVEKVYNLTVANTHNYFVGGDGVLVHNCLTKAQAARVKKIDEIEHMLKSHKNLSGDPNFLDDGHLQKLREAKRGLTKARDAIEKSLNNRNLNQDARSIIEERINTGNQLIGRIDELVP